jgi:tRNA dimethylallyltransferase
MIETGLEEEANSLYNYRNLNAMKCVGYREFFDVIDGKITRDKAIELIKRNTRRYAKRQLTWWAKEKDIRWFQPEQVEEIIEYCTAIYTPFNSPQGGGKISVI